MRFQFISYIIPLSISALIVAGLAYYGFRHKRVRGAKAFTASMMIGFIWVGSNALEMAGAGLSTKLFWANVQYVAYAFAPVAWLVMVLQFTDRAHLVNKGKIILLSIIPLITILLAWTNHIHGLIRHNFALDTSGSFSVIEKSYGFWFWVHCSYTYLLNLVTVILLGRIVWKKNTIYRKQAFYLLAGFVLLMTANLLYVSGLGPSARFDISPIVFSITGLIISWGIFHFRLFDLVPIARETVIEKMGSGIIVIDKLGRIIDHNPQAGKMLGLEEKTITGAPLSAVSEKLQKIVYQEEENNLHPIEFAYQNGNKAYSYEVYTSPIRDYRQELAARVLIFNDITDLKGAREQISLQKQELAVRDERERMARDLHDNLGQILSFANVQIQAVRKQLKKGNQELADNYLQRLNTIIKDAHKDIREYIYNIRSDLTHKGDYLTLLQEEIGEFRQVCSFDINLMVDKGVEQRSFGIEEKVQLLNIVKESLTNIIKHAEADVVDISLRDRDDSFQMIIADDGKGITDPDRKTGSGISIMKERARLVGGELRVETSSGIGTKIVVSLD